MKLTVGGIKVSPPHYNFFYVVTKGNEITGSIEWQNDLGRWLFVPKMNVGFLPETLAEIAKQIENLPLLKPDSIAVAVPKAAVDLLNVVAPKIEETKKKRTKK